MRWDPVQYGRYADERGRPFRDLLARIGAEDPRRVVDLGCGPGTLTALLADRWPRAKIRGLDSSPEMIEQADALELPRTQFKLTDVADWMPRASVDVVISNATLQWVPGHDELLRNWAAALGDDAWLAWQVPGNFGAPSHTLLRELATSDRWAAKVGNVLRHDHVVLEPAEYAELLLDAGWSADVWETRYQHVLTGTDPVLEWLRGTGLRPVLAALDAQDPSGTDRGAFETEFAAELRAAYPANNGRTLLEFRRIFAVGHKPPQ